jgi:hypothetical protein
MSKKYTQIEAESKVNKRCQETNYILLKPFIYNNSLTKLNLKCNIHNHEWEVSFNNFINNKTICKLCGIKNTAISKLKSQIEVENDIIKKCEILNYTYKPFIYIDNKTSNIYLKCGLDNNEWNVSYNNFINQNTCCPKCGNRPKITQDIAEENIKNVCKQNDYIFKPFIYKNNLTKIYLKCNNDNYEWNTTYQNLINSKTGCPKCANLVSPSQEDAINNINKMCIEKNYTLTKPFIYENCNSIISLKCNSDNHEWNTTYKRFINRQNGCLKCTGNLLLSQQETEQNINKMCIEKNYILTKPFIYNGNKTRIYLKCNKDNYEWDLSYSHFLFHKTGCPKCAGSISPSQEEAEYNINKMCIRKNYILIKPFIYTNCYSKISLKCNVDFHEWETTYSSFINQENGCYVCGKKCKKIRK